MMKQNDEKRYVAEVISTRLPKLYGGQAQR
jgi:hypothetical protein